MQRPNTLTFGIPQTCGDVTTGAIGLGPDTGLEMTTGAITGLGTDTEGGMTAGAVIGLGTGTGGEGLDTGAIAVGVAGPSTIVKDTVYFTPPEGVAEIV